MPEPKHALRRKARAARDGISAEARADASHRVAERALAVPEIASARGVLAYAATPQELDPSPLLAALRERGARVAYPRVCGPGGLTLHWSDTGDLAPGYCGILEPHESAEPAAFADLDVVLVPGVAFDEACCRLGMGGGFYDRLLPAMRPDTLRVGLAFDEQVVPTVPTEEHDVSLDAVVTPTRTLRPGR
jgi:5-formyltetrahydrofolate cyclo-ligase